MPESQYYKKLASEAILKGAALPTFATVFVGLGTAGFTLNENSEPVLELSASGYSRLPVTLTDFTDEMSNVAPLIWVVTSSWVPITDVFIADSMQGGKALLYDSAGVKAVTTGDIVKVDVGGLRIL